MSKGDRPSRLGDVLAGFLDTSGLSDRVAQARVIPEWSSLVGPQISEVAVPVSLQRDGTLVVAVKSRPWLTELSLMEPELLRALNADTSRPPIARLRMVMQQ